MSRFQPNRKRYSGSSRASVNARLAEDKGLVSAVDAARELGIKPWRALQDAATDALGDAPEWHHIKVPDDPYAAADFRTVGDWRAVAEAARKLASSRRSGRMHWDTFVRETTRIGLVAVRVHESLGHARDGDKVIGVFDGRKIGRVKWY